MENMHIISCFFYWYIFFPTGMPLFQHNTISSASCLQNGAPTPLMNWSRSQPPQMTPGQGGANFSSQRGATPNPHPHHAPEALPTSWSVDMCKLWIFFEKNTSVWKIFSFWWKISNLINFLNFLKNLGILYR